MIITYDLEKNTIIKNYNGKLYLKTSIIEFHFKIKLKHTKM